mmetsp:Transcript_21028/g.59734  ORF Transcript_21028/g.59734 Transcript_21028/m.59734 type:complete len:205 (+) Transcript_21028:651-1265(+)
MGGGQVHTLLQGGGPRQEHGPIRRGRGGVPHEQRRVRPGQGRPCPHPGRRRARDRGQLQVPPLLDRHPPGLRGRPGARHRGRGPQPGHGRAGGPGRLQDVRPRGWPPGFWARGPLGAERGGRDAGAPLRAAGVWSRRHEIAADLGGLAGADPCWADVPRAPGAGAERLRGVELLGGVGDRLLSEPDAEAESRHPSWRDAPGRVR